MKKITIEVVGAGRTFALDEEKIVALKPAYLTIFKGDFVIIYGPSGCGKTTLLNIICGVDKPTEGKVYYNSIDLFGLDEDSRGVFRLNNIGMVYQMSYWVKSLNVLENIALPLIIKKEKKQKAKNTAWRLLEELEITKLAYKRPYQLSSGEQQKIGVARALINDPKVLIADEPTGNLDSKSADDLLKTFKKLNKIYKKTIILVTHNEKYYNEGTRLITMKDGEITENN